MPYLPKAFRPGTWDENIYDSIVNHNEYGIGNFTAGEVVVDIGTHIGSFAVLSMLRGAEKVYAYEALPENYELAVQNTAEFKNVFVFNKAVTRSDRKIDKLYFARCTAAHNTGGGSVFAESSPLEVAAISLDEILEEIGQPVQLLKLDCEGSEFPILFTSKKLDRVKIILGEYHNFSSLADVPESLRVDGIAGYDIAILHDFLTLQGFRGGWTHDKENLGKFRYVREG